MHAWSCVPQTVASNHNDARCAFRGEQKPTTRIATFMAWTWNVTNVNCVMHLELGVDSDDVDMWKRAGLLLVETFRSQHRPGVKIERNVAHLSLAIAETRAQWCS